MTATAAGFEGQSNGDPISVANSDDFGDTAWGLVNLVGAGTAVYRTTDAMHGSVCAEVAGATSSDAAELRWTTFNSTTLAIQFYFKFGNVAPSSQIAVCLWRDTSGTIAGGFALSTVGRLVAIQTSSGTQIAATSDPRADIVADTWYRVDGMVTRATTSTGRLIYQLAEVDAPPKFHYDSGATLNFGTVNLGRSYFGKLTQAPTWSGVHRFDSLRVDDARTTLYDPVAASDAFPVFTQQSFEIGTSLNTANAQANPPLSATGDLIIQTVANDNPGATTISASTGWTQIFHEANGTTIKMAMFARVLDGSGDDALAVTGASQDYCAQAIRFPAGLHGCTNAGLGTEIKVATAATGSSAAADPPSLDAGASGNWMWIAVAAMETTTASVFTDDPTSYSNICRLKSAASTTSCAMAMAWRQNATQTENPAAFANTDRDWVAQTVAVPPFSIPETDIDPVGAVSVSATGTADVGGQADVTPVGAASVTATGTANVAGTADVSATGAVSVSATGTADVTSIATISPVGAISVTATGTADVTGHTAVNPVGAVSLTATGTANVGAQADVSATGAVSVTVTGAANVEAQADITPTGAVSLTATGTADVSSAPSINPVGAVSLTASGTADVTGHTAVSATGAVSLTATGTADVTATIDINPTGAASITVTGTADVGGQADIAPTGAVSVTVSGIADVATGPVVDPVGAVSLTTTGTANVTGHASITATGAVSVTATGTADVTAQADVTPTGAVSVTVTGTAALTAQADIDPVGAVSVTVTGVGNLIPGIDADRPDEAVLVLVSIPVATLSLTTIPTATIEVGAIIEGALAWQA